MLSLRAMVPRSHTAASQRQNGMFAGRPSSPPAAVGELDSQALDLCLSGSTYGH